MKVLLIGNWHENKALKFKKEAEELGVLLARGNHTLITGGGTGISDLVATSYKQNNGKRFMVYLTSKRVMEKIGEESGRIKPDKVINTNKDYPERNIVMLKKCDIVISIGGGLGSLTEIIHAINDYKKPVYLFKKGDLYKWVIGIEVIKSKIQFFSKISELKLK